MRILKWVGVAVLGAVLLASCGRDNSCTTYNPSDPTCSGYSSLNSYGSSAYGSQQGYGYQDPSQQGYNNGYGNSQPYQGN